MLAIVGGDGEAVASQKRAGFRVGGNSDVFQLIPETVAFDQLNMSQQFLRAQGRPDPGQYECVLNLVTDPDQHPQTLQRVRKLLRGYRGRVINRPEAVLRTTRDLVAKRLSGIDGLLVPQVLRLRNPKPGAASLAAQRANLAFPLIVRLAGTHTGKSVRLAANPQEVEAACSEPGDYILTEFVDYRSPDGLYRKYRFWSFGRRDNIQARNHLRPVEHPQRRPQSDHARAAGPDRGRDANADTSRKASSRPPCMTSSTPSAPAWASTFSAWISAFTGTAG